MVGGRKTKTTTVLESMGESWKSPGVKRHFFAAEIAASVSEGVVKIAEAFRMRPNLSTRTSRGTAPDSKVVAGLLAYVADLTCGGVKL